MNYFYYQASKRASSLFLIEEFIFLCHFFNLITFVYQAQHLDHP